MIDIISVLNTQRKKSNLDYENHISTMEEYFAFFF